MSFMLISTQIRLECGPTLCGDQWTDPAIMEAIGATLQEEPGNIFKVYKSPEPPRIILDKLAGLGYRVVSCGGVGQTCIWTLFKEP